MAAPRHAAPAGGAGPFVSARFAAEVRDWLQCRAAPDERARYSKYMALIQDAAAAAEREAGAEEAAALGTARSGASAGSGGGGGGSGGGSTARSRRAPKWSAIPDVTTPAALEAAARRARQASAPASSARAGAGAGGAADLRPASAAPAAWAHTATVAGRRGAATSAPAAADSTRPASAAVAPAASPAAPGTRPDLQLPLGPAPSATTAAACPPSPTATLSARAAAAAAAPPPPKIAAADITTSVASYGLKSLYPDLWANTLPICRPEAAPNKNFVSDWGDSLRKGSDETWAPFLASTYTAANAQVHKPTDDFRVRQQRALAGWVARQRTYCEGLLSRRAAGGVMALLEALPGSEKTELVELLRQISAVVQPESAKPYSHELHRPQYSVEDAETTRLMKEQTRIKTMGMPRKAEVRGFKHAPPHAPRRPEAAGDTKAAAEAAAEEAAGAGEPARRAAAAAGRGAAPAAKASEMVETLRSKCPLKWVCSELYPNTSSYTASFGARPSRSKQMHKVVFPEVNAGWGHVDEVRYPPTSQVYAIPQCYYNAPRILGAAPSADDAKTTQRLSYGPRDQGSAARGAAAAREQIEASRAARHVSRIPLSKAGVQAAPQWGTTYCAEFRGRGADLTANRAMAAAVSEMFNGPTISFGRIMGMRKEAAARPAAAGGGGGGAAAAAGGAGKPPQGGA